jgi:hypothetical protein
MVPLCHLGGAWRRLKGLKHKFTGCHRRGQAWVGAVPGRRPLYGPVTPHIELTKRIEEAKILMILAAAQPELLVDRM